MGGRRERDVVWATLEPLWDEFAFFLQHGDSALEPAECIAHPEEAPVGGVHDCRCVAILGENIPNGAIPAVTDELFRYLVLFFRRKEY